MKLSMAGVFSIRLSSEIDFTAYPCSLLVEKVRIAVCHVNPLIGT